MIEGPWVISLIKGAGRGRETRVLKITAGKGRGWVGSTICIMGPGLDAEANLITAAPDLLVALKKAMRCLESLPFVDEEAMRLGREALKKASHPDR